MSHRKKCEILEDEIEATRRRIEARLGHLNQSVGPVGLISTALGTESDSMPETLSALANKAKANPVSALLIGVGVASLLMSDNRPDGPPRATAATDDSDNKATPAERVAQNTATLKANARDTVSSVASDARNAASSVRETAAEVARRGRKAVAGAVDSVSEASDALADATRAAPRDLKARSNQLVEWVQKNPLPASLMALAAGAGIASVMASRNTTTPDDRFRTSQRLHEMAREEESVTGLTEMAAATKAETKVTTRGNQRAVRNTSKKGAAGKKGRPVESVRSLDPG